MAQMTAVWKIQTHESAVGRHDGLVNLQVGRAATEALDIDTPLSRVEVEGLESTLLAKKLNLVDVLVSTIVSGTGVALGVLVGHGRAQSIEHGAGRDIFGGDEDDGLSLALDLLFLQAADKYIANCPLPWIGELTMISATSGSESRRDFSSI